MELEKLAMAAEVEVKEKEKLYPSPLHTHDGIVGDKEAFMDTLRRFHSSMGTKFMIPVIGGKDLDLHLLYVEVTKRGGLEKVIEEKKWREVIAEFKFPPTTTSASFVLRRYYLSLLHHYEQVYFFRAQGPLIPPSASSQTKTPLSKLDHGLIVSDSTMQKPRNRKRSLNPEPQSKGSYNFTVSGSIDGKFEHGYLVTVKIGSETLRGVLYHVHQPIGVGSASVAVASGGTTGPSNGGTNHLRRRRKRGWRHRDPAHPKPNRSAYNFFFAEKHSKLKALYPHREREFSKMIGESWNKLSEEERMVYQNYGIKDKERYKREMQEYRESLKLVQPKEVGQAQLPEMKADEA
ncbi:high mobility group B protein 9 [Typha angustifolia]|uniref:high mobility group B protein 9 n=1 Tax=Typha angustifolia TaxID=59011 RepID=UPI003C2B5EAD